MFFISVLSCILQVQSLFHDPRIEHVTSQELVSIIENPDYMTMTIIYDISTQGSIALNQVLLDLLPKYENYVKFVALDCDDVPDICKPEIRPQMPIFQGYVPAGINPYTSKPLIHEKGYQGAISSKDIGNFFTEHVPYLGEYLTPDNLDRFQSEEGNKVLLFTNKEKVPMIYRGLSSKYRGFLEFGLVFLNQTDLISQYDIIDFPTLLVIEGEDVVNYEGKIDFDEISAFLEPYKSLDKKPLKAKRAVSKPKQEPQPEAKIPEIPIHALTSKNFRDFLIEDAGLFLVHFFKDRQLDDWEEVKATYNGVAKLATFHCKSKEDQEVCAGLGVKKYPCVRIFPVNRKRKSFEVSVGNKEDFEEEISRELRYDIMTIQEATVQTFVNSVHEEGKVGILLINEGAVPLQIRGIASEEGFKDFVKFGYFNRPKEVALSIFSIKSYPALIAFAKTDGSGSMQVIEYPGKFDDYKSLFYFVDEMAIPTFSKKKKRKIAEEDQEDLEIIHSAAGFNSKCLRKSGICLIGLFDGNPKDAPDSYKILKNARAQIDQRKLPVHFVALDGKCQHEIRESFGISEISLPNVAAFHTSKKRGTRLVGKFNVDDITLFTENLLRGKQEIFEVNKVEYVDRECVEVEPVAESAEDDEILNEILKGAEEKQSFSKKSDTRRGRKRKGKSKDDL